jgi:hypothetical protein
MKLREKYTIEYIESNNLVLLKTLVGSYSQNLQTEKSDKDYFGVFYIQKEDYDSLEYKMDPFDTVISTSSENDVTYIEITKFITLLYNNNPNALEILASSKIEGNYVVKSEWIDKLDINKIISKKCLDTFGKYASTQVKKATGLNKKMNNPIPVAKKSPLNFCYIYGNNNFKNGTPFLEALEKLDIDQIFIGLKPIEHCKSTYEVYFDQHSFICFSEFEKAQNIRSKYQNIDDLKSLFNFAKFKGAIHPEQFSPQIRISSIPNINDSNYQISFVGYIYYNLEGFETYLKDYKEYMEWVEKRNPERYKNNIGQKYDVKNLSHCARLLTVAKEIGEGKGLILKRISDKDFFVDIKLGKVEYDDILNYTNQIIEELPSIYENSNIMDSSDFGYFNNYIIEFNSYRK